MYLDNRLIMKEVTQNRRTCTPIRSGMLDKLDAFVVPNCSFCNDELTFEDCEKISQIVNKRRPYCSSDFDKRYMIPDLSDI